MKISVLVVSLNAGDALLATIHSILAQKDAEFEIIVKDGGSTDGSIDKIPADARIRIVTCKDSGIYDAMNQAAQYATGDYSVYLNCGDLFHNAHVLNNVLAAISSCSQTADTIFYGDCYTVNRNSVLRYPDVFDDYLCFTKVLCHQATIYPTQMLRKRQFSEKYRIAADYEYYVYAYTHGVALVHLPIIIVDYQGNGASETKRNRALALQESKQIRKENFPSRRYFKAWTKAQLHGVGIKQFLVQQEWFYPLYKKLAALYYRRKNGVSIEQKDC